MAENQKAHTQVHEPQSLYALKVVAVDAAIFFGENENHLLLRVGRVWQCDCEAYVPCDAQGRCRECEHTFALKHYLATGQAA